MNELQEQLDIMRSGRFSQMAGRIKLQPNLILDTDDPIKWLLMAFYGYEHPDFENVRNNGNLNPLLIAVLFHHWKLTLSLINRGFDPNVVDKDGNNGFMLATSSNFDLNQNKIITMTIMHSLCDINHRNYLNENIFDMTKRYNVLHILEDFFTILNRNHYNIHVL